MSDMKYVTTLEQSALLEASGLDIRTADFFYCKSGSGYLLLTDAGGFSRFNVIPAWSFGALWNILYENGVTFYEYATNESAERVMNSLYSAVERALRQGKIKSPSVN